MHNKKTEEGLAERLALLGPVFPEIQRHLMNRPPGVGKDDLLDAAAAAWNREITSGSDTLSEQEGFRGDFLSVKFPALESGCLCSKCRFRARARAAVLDLLRPRSGERILDLGCADIGPNA
jgi:Protein of unknown function (DUF429)